MTVFQLLSAFFPSLMIWAIAIKGGWEYVIKQSVPIAIEYWTNFNALTPLWGL